MKKDKDSGSIEVLLVTVEVGANTHVDNNIILKTAMIDEDEDFPENIGRVKMNTKVDRSRILTTIIVYSE